MRRSLLPLLLLTLTFTVAEAQRRPVTAPPGDDWPQFGHDAFRTFVSRDEVEGPFTIAWTYTVEGARGETSTPAPERNLRLSLTHKGVETALPPAVKVLKVIAAAGHVHLSAATENNGAGTRSKFKDPLIISLDGNTGAYNGVVSIGRDWGIGHWLAVFGKTNVLYNEDALGWVDARTGRDRRLVKVDRWGPMAVDERQGVLLHQHILMADDDHPLMECTSLKGGKMWRANVWKAPKPKGLRHPAFVAIAGPLALLSTAYPEGATPTPPTSGLYAFALKKGQQLWLHEGRFDSLNVGRGLALVTTGDKARAVDLRSGQTKWEVALPAGVATHPGVFGERWVVPTTSGTVAIDLKTGAKAWSADVSPNSRGLGKHPTSMVIDAKGRAWLLDGTTLVGLDLTTGKVIGRHPLPESLTEVIGGSICDPLIHRGQLLIHGDKGVACLWPASFLRKRSSVVLKTAAVTARQGAPKRALGMLDALSKALGAKGPAKVKSARAKIEAQGAKALAGAERLRGRKHLHAALARTREIAEGYPGLGVEDKAKALAGELETQLKDPAVAAEAGYLEAGELERRDKAAAAKRYQEIAQAYGSTEFGKKAAQKYERLKRFIK